MVLWIGQKFRRIFLADDRDALRCARTEENEDERHSSSRQNHRSLCAGREFRSQPTPFRLRIPPDVRFMFLFTLSIPPEIFCRTIA